MLKQTILIVEDEPDIRHMIKFALGNSNYQLLEAENATAAQKIIATQIPNLILLDWMLPHMSGIQFAKRLKQNDDTKYIPIIMLTAKASEEEKVKGLETGADDYITKPFSPRELIARIKSVLRRGPLVSPEDTLNLANLTIDKSAHQVTIDGNNVNFSRIEFRLLYFFMTHQGRVYTREQLLQNVWNNENYIDERTVDVQIVRLRKVLNKHNCPALIHTVHGVGYKFGILEKMVDAHA